MNSYMATIRCESNLNQVIEGNAFFEATQLTKGVLDTLKAKHCETITKRCGAYCNPDHACVTFVAKLDV